MCFSLKKKGQHLHEFKKKTVENDEIILNSFAKKNIPEHFLRHVKKWGKKYRKKAVFYCCML